MNTITRKDKHCNNYEEALLSKTFRFIFNKVIKTHWGENKVLLKSIFDKFISQESISDQEKEILNAFLSNREVKILAEEIRQKIDFSRMSKQEKKEIMDDFTAEHLINTLQNKISGEVFLTLDNKGVEVLKTYWNLQVLAIYKDKIPYYAIKKIGEKPHSKDFIFTWEKIPEIIPIMENWECIWYGFSDNVNIFFKRIFTLAWARYEDNWEIFYDWIVKDEKWNTISDWVVILWDEFNEDGTIKYINLDNIPKAIAE